MIIYLVRHGETVANVKGLYVGKSEIALTKKGEIQSDNAIRYLKNHGVDVVYSSPSKRCMRIATAIKDIGEIKVDDRLREEDFGIFEGLTWEQVKEKRRDDWEKWCNDFDYQIPEGESFISFYNRVAAFFNELISGPLNSSLNIVVVTHGGPIRAILSKIVADSHEAFWRFKIDNGSITKINVVDGYAIIEALNYR